jgi:uncharacterized low-complexity protein
MGKKSPKQTIRTQRMAATMSATTSATKSAIATTTTTTASKSATATALATNSKSGCPKRCDGKETGAVVGQGDRDVDKVKSAEDKTPQDTSDIARKVEGIFCGHLGQ